MRKKFLAILFAILTFAGVVASQGQNGVWLDVPFVKQSEEGCGSAAVSMLLQYWNAHGASTEVTRFSAESIQEKLYSRKAHGIFASDLEKYIRESGFKTFTFEGKWDDLREHLVQGRPLVVGLHPIAGKSSLHYVVITGMDWSSGAVFVNDPARGKLLRIERADFEKEWHPVHNWMLLAVPQQAN